MANTSELTFFERLMTSGCGSLVRSDSPTGCKTMYYLVRTCPFVLLLVGTVGNLLNLVVLFRRQMRSMSTTVYLLFLAWMDLITLWNALIRTTLAIGWRIDIKTWSLFICATQPWLALVSSCLSADLVALISIERMLLVKFPIWARQRVTRRKALIASIGAVVLTSALTSPAAIANTLNILQTNPPSNESTVTPDLKCYISPHSRLHTIDRAAYIIAGVRNAVSMAIVIVSNGVMVVKLLAQRRRQKSRAQIVMTEGQRANLEKNRALTRMTMLLAGYLTITGLPFSILVNTFETLTKDVSEDEYYFYAVVRMCLYYIAFSNCALNFFFYFSSGPMFKRELRAIWEGLSTKVRQLWA